MFRHFRRFFMMVVGFVLSTIMAFSQVDYEFWFAAPYGNTDHAPYWPQEYPYKVGGRPIYLRLATQDADADITVTLPALGVTVANLNIKANSTASVDLTPYLANIQCSKEGNVVEDKGIYIRSNALITAYYEIASVLNTDIFSLKGQNALGKEFYTPFQNLMTNDQYHNGEGVPDNGIYGDAAYSYIVIVATQDHTVVNIKPTTNCVGISSGSTKTVTLDRGQTYVVRSTGQDINSRMSGTYIKSTKPIAVTIGEDSAYPDYYTNSGDCEDYIGDQLTPTSVTGTDYLVVQGQGYSAAKNTGKNFYEIVAVTATMDNTVIKLDGTQYGSVLNKGETISIELSDPNAIYTFIQASHPVYAFHISGYHCEVAGALLPSVEMCTGSYKMGFVRTYGSQNDQEFYMNLMVKGDGEKDFLLNGESNDVINNANFQEIDGTEWKVARIYFSRYDMPEGAYFLQNTTSLFHMGMMNSTAHDWGDGQGYRLMGSMYGYFSRFSDNFPSAKIVNNNDTSITVTRNTKVSLLADGGNKFSWKGYMWDGHDWVLMDAPYYMNATDVENPYVMIDALGIYKYTATISTDCYDDVERSILIKIVEPVDLNIIRDTVCYTPGLSPNNDMSEAYNLFNLNDTIVGKKGLITGFYVDHFDKFVDADTVMWDDFENGSMNLTIGRLGDGKSNGSLSVVSNPDLIYTAEHLDTVSYEANTSDYVLHMVRTSANGSNEQEQLSIWADYDVSDSPITITEGTKFTFDIKADDVNTDWCNNPHSIYMEVFDAASSSISVLGVSLPERSNNVSSPDSSWYHVVCDFSSYAGQIGTIEKVRIRAFLTNGWIYNYGYYIDNVKYFSTARVETIKNPKKYTITDGDSLYAIVRNNFDITRSDTSMVYFKVKNPGIEKRTVQLADTCATEGNLLKEFNLLNYNYATGGALVADRLWYYDSQRTKAIEEPEFVDVEAGDNIFYVYVDDECEDIPGELKLTVYAIPEVQDAEVSVCEIPSMGGDQGLIDLDAMKSKITTDAGATFEWYSDYQYTKKMGSISSVPVTDGKTFYAKVYYSDRCPSLAQLTVSVTPVDDIVFDDFEVCQDAGTTALVATPTGGTFEGDGVATGSFNPETAGVGKHEISYTISNQGCTNTATAIATVNPEVSVDLVNLSGKLKKGESANLKATISPASSDYAYTWSDASKLQNAKTLTPTTVSLEEPTYYTIDVENTKTGCTASAKVLVDVYIPVRVSLELEPVCAGSDVTIEANRVGGTGPFTYVWSLTPTTAYTAVNDSVITIKNVQSDVKVKVTVTDTKEGDVVSAEETQVVYANPTLTLDDATICQGSSLELKPTVTGGTAPYTSEWTGNVDILKTATSSQNVSVNTNDNVGTYYLTYKATDKNGCYVEKPVTVVVNQKPVVAATSDKTTSCFGETVKLSSSLEVGASSGASYEWTSKTYSTADLSSTTIPNPTYTSYISGVHQFELIFTDANGCKDTSDVVSVRIEPRPTVTINAVDDQCASNQGVQLSATPKVEGVPDATFAYEWSGDVTSTDENPMLDISTPGVKNISLQVTANNGCISDVVKGQVLVNSNPLADIATKDLMVCANDTITLQANTSSSNVTYEWSATAPLLSNTGSSVQIVPANPIGSETVPHTISLTVTDNTTGCTSVTTTGMTAFRLPEITLGDDIELCDGSSIELEPLVKYAYQGTYTTKWFLDTLQLSSTDVINPIYTQVGTDTYNIGIEITDGNGCKSNDQIDIKGLELPKPNAGDDRIEDWGKDFILDGSATGGVGPYTYLWSPADSLKTAPTLQKPTANVLESTIFSLEVTDSKGCKGSDEVIITIIGQPLKVSIIQKPDPLCYGNSAVLEAIPSGGTGVYKYEWYNLSDPSTVIGTEKTLDIAPLENTVYKVVLNSIGEKAFDPTSATHAVQVYSLPTVALLGEANPHVCQGDNIMLVPSVTGTSPYTYQWNDGSPITVKTETYLFSNSQITGNKDMKLIVTDAMGCSDSLLFKVRVDELPEITIDEVTECVNVEATIVANVTKGTAPYNYVWEGLVGVSSQGATAKYTATAAGSYSVDAMVVDVNGCSGTASQIITIKPESDLALEPTYSVCANEELILDINPNNIPGSYVMHWVGGEKKRIVDSTVITRSVFMSPNEGEYTLNYTIADEYNCPVEKSTVVTVYPAVKLADIEDKNVCAGVDLTIKAEVTTGNPTSFNWLGSVSPKNEKTTVFSSNKPGEYEVTVIAGDQHCSDTKEFSVTVQPNPAVEIIGAPIKVVDYTSQVTLLTNIVTYTTSPFTHVWSDEANIASGATTSSIVTKPVLATTEYVYTLTDKYGCTAEASIKLQTEVIIPIITRFVDGEEMPINDNELIDGNSVRLTEDALELCIGESGYLIPQFVSGNTEGLTYSWKDDDNNNLGHNINILVTPTKASTVYTLTVSNEAGFSTDVTFVVLAHPIPTVDITVSPEYNGLFYTNETLVLDGNPTSTEYGVEFVSHQWSVNQDVNLKNADKPKAYIGTTTPTAVTISYEVVDENGCKASSARDIEIVDQKIPVIIGKNVCVNDTAVYHLEISYPKGTTYYWSVEGGKILNDPTSASVQVYWTDTKNTKLTVSVYPSNDRPIENLTRNVYVTPYPDVTINGQVHVCVGESATYEAINNIPDVTPSSELLHSWSVADNHGAITDVSYPVSNYATVSWNKEGEDQVILHTSYGFCAVKDTLDVYIHPVPDANFTYYSSEDVYFMDEDTVRHTDSIFVDKEVTFTNLTTKKANYDFFWDFIGDGVYTENAYNTTYEYDETGDFMVSLMVVESTWGCKNVIAKPLKVVPNPNCGLTFPNAFTPDLSENNTFYPVFRTGVLETGYELRVYNRWGTMLWSTTDIDGQWDGVYKGSISKQDVYVYHCKAVCEDVDPSTGKHRELNVKGDVTIIR